jgi:hypothetical protein
MATALENANRLHEFQQGSSAVHFKLMTDIVCEHQLPVSLLLKRVLGLSDGLPVSIESDLVSALALKPFRTMSVVPTLSELTDTPTHASLPRRPFGSTVDELLGCHFQLVREDMLGPVRADLKKGVANTQPIKTLYNVHVTGVHRDEVVMSFELHKDHACHKMSDDHKRYFWERTRFCYLYGLVFLLDNVRPVCLAFVTGRQHILQNKVGLTFQFGEDLDALLRELERPCEHRTVFNLTSIALSFFSYEPVLRRLQHHRVLPFEADLLDGPSCDPPVYSTDEHMEALTNLTTRHSFNASQVNASNIAMTHRVTLF